ncbi:MAG: 50S ribosome-binding GTPase [Acidobacteria bacterium]|nr:50S ribosome-binding GTPase [Acidobacteriota bacterium]
MSGLLRICTGGSVDDGKSTLIGRMLHDAQAVYEDQVHSVRAASANRGVGPIDFSLFTDGLRAEREQGITIDVAYRYFATAHRKFILADTPGHEQYTRNMATGASTADVAILLVDARHGLRVQSRRHARIARLLGISDFVIAVNKMDLVDFSRDVFDEIRDDFATLLEGARCHAIPLSALHGDNVIARSARTPWFAGPPLLEHLETVDVGRNVTAQPFRLPVQLVLRPNDGFRGYAGQIASGIVRVGDRVAVWPSGRSARVTRIVTFDGDRLMVFAPMSITLTLDEELDISRGDLLAQEGPHVGCRFEADVVWMDERPLDPNRLYLLKHTTRTVTAEVSHGLVLNQIGTLTVSTTRPLVFDAYRHNRATGSFVLIDTSTCFTAGAGMIAAPVAGRAARAAEAPVSAAERLARLARRAGSDEEAARAVAQALEEMLT